MLVSIVLYHNSHDSFFRNPFGALPCSEKVRLRILVKSESTITHCFLRIWLDEREVILPMKIREDDEIWKEIPQEVLSQGLEGGEIYEVDYSVPAEPGLIWYFFIVKTASQSIFYGDFSHLGGEGRTSYMEPPGYQITVYEPMTLPQWYTGGIIYQIYVDRFFNGNENGKVNNPHPKALIHSNWYDKPFYIKNPQGDVIRWNFFGGNLQGVLKKLPYLKELGVSIIYFNPIFASPSNHKYDTGDYLSIDPMYGDREIFENLIQEGKREGISIILDGVFSHTGDDSIYFNRYGHYPSIGASQSPNSPYYSWYKWQEDGQVSYWWGVKSLPEVNELDPSYRHFVIHWTQGVLHTWMKKGIKGWRLDVADELPDEFIQEFRRGMKELDQDSVLIGEVWEDASRKKSYGKLRQYLWGHELGGTMNYPFREIFIDFFLGKVDSWQVHRQVMSLYENYPRENFYGAMNLIGSHDRVRILTVLGEAPPQDSLSSIEQENYLLDQGAKRLAIKRLKMLTLIQMSFPGVPSLYYGDEAGLEGYEDPYNRGTYPWGKENQEIFDWMKRVLHYRQEYRVLEEGDFISWPIDDQVYGLKRSKGQETMVILINNSTSEYEVHLDLANKGSGIKEEEEVGIQQIIDVFEGSVLFKEGEDIKPLTLSLQPLSGKALFCSRTSLENYFPPKLRTRSCGVLLAISSLPSSWGVGDLGQGAYDFVDFLASAGQSIWQVLPINPLGLGDSPYQSESAFAGDPLFLDLEFFVEMDLLTREEIKGTLREIYINKVKKTGEVSEFEMIRSNKTKLLRQAFQKFHLAMEHGSQGLGEASYFDKEQYEEFLRENNNWLQDYALYLILKEKHNGLPWNKWEDEYRLRAPNALDNLQVTAREEIDYIYFVQYTFRYQWEKLKRYANQKNITLMGDIPIFVATDSCDTWANPDIFELNEEFEPRYVAGVPPDYFSPEGQNWGNPVYNWDRLAQRDFTWWKERLRQALERYDSLRLDHFRGFQGYWAIPGEKEPAKRGRWLKGPGKAFFEAMHQELGSLPTFPEDLGTITSEVEVLRNVFGFPSMKVLQFSSLEEVKDENIVFYSGTHDNDTLLGYYLAQGYDQAEAQTMVSRAIEDIYHSRANWVILPLQDVLRLDSQGRMNTPGTIAGNWQFRVEKGDLTQEICHELRELAGRTKRLPQIP